MEKFDIEHDELANTKQPESVYEITWRVLSNLMDVIEERMQAASDEYDSKCESKP